jgi:archaellin
VFGGQRGLEVAPVLIALVVLPGTYAGAVIGVAGLKEEWAPARVSEPPR